MALEERIEADLACGHHRALVGELEALVREHPLRECFRAQLMLALYRADRQADALQVYRETRDYLQVELGLEPSKRLQRLEQGILEHDGELELEPDANAQPPSGVAKQRNAPASSATAPPPDGEARRLPHSAPAASRRGRRHRSGSRGGDSEPPASLRSHRQDPTLDAEAPPEGGVAKPPPGAGPTAMPGGRWVAGLIALSAVVIAGVIVVVVDGGGGGPTVEPNSVAMIDTGTDRLTADVPVGVQPADISAGEHAAWVANSGDASVSRIDTRTRRVSETIAPGPAVDGMAAGEGAVWTSDGRRELMARIDPGLGRVDRSVRFGKGRGLGPSAAPTMATGGGSVWIHTGEDSVVRINPTRVRVEAHIPLTDAGRGKGGIAIGDGGVWVANGDTDTVTRIDPSTDGIVTTIPVGRGASGIAAGEDGVWVADTLDNTVVRIDPGTNSVTSTIDVGKAPSGVAVGAGAVWVANSGDGTVSRIDPQARRVSATIDVGQSPQSLAVAGGALWVTAQAAPRSSRESAVRGEGSAATIVTDAGEDTDPAFASPSPITYATSAELLNYRDRPFPSGARLEPEVARGMPVVTNGGKTYTFRLRHGYRFSPPSNQPVTAAAFQRAIERALNPRMQSFAGDLIRDIVGVLAYQAGRTRHIAGVTARGNRLTIKLIYPSPSLPARLAAPFFSAVPPATPVDPSGIEGIPSAGPTTSPPTPEGAWC